MVHCGCQLLDDKVLKSFAVFSFTIESAWSLRVATGIARVTPLPLSRFVIGSGPVKIWNQDNRATTVLEALVTTSSLERQVIWRRRSVVETNQEPPETVRHLDARIDVGRWRHRRLLDDVIVGGVVVHFWVLLQVLEDWQQVESLEKNSNKDSKNGSGSLAPKINNTRAKTSEIST